MRCRNILVIKLGALGDVALSLPHIMKLAEAHTNDRVTLLTAPAYAELAAGLPLQVVSFGRKGFAEMLRLMRWLLGQQFDVVYDLQGSLRSRVMTQLTQAEKRVGRGAGIAYTHTPDTQAGGVHAFERFNALLLAGGVEAALPRSGLPISPAAAERVAGWLQQQGLAGEKLVPVHAGSSRGWPSKRWPERYFSLLAGALEDRGLKIVWIGSQHERSLNARLAAHAGVDATSEFGLDGLLALAAQAMFAVSNDSGPMHVLSAAGLPVYALFGPTDWRRSHAVGQAERVLFKQVPCSPCHLPECPLERGHVCMQGVTPEAVMKRLATDGLLPRQDNCQVSTAARLF
jgi:ADP-heptose:LPS heptosyltransferase